MEWIFAHFGPDFSKYKPNDFFFFFQAEDGIRDWSVTGVQTCALPICNVVFTPSNVNPQIEANVPSKLLQGLLESRDARLTFSIICGAVHEYADTTSLLDRKSVV